MYCRRKADTRIGIEIIGRDEHIMFPESSKQSLHEPSLMITVSCPIDQDQVLGLGLATAVDRGEPACVLHRLSHSLADIEVVGWDLNAPSEILAKTEEQGWRKQLVL